MAKGDHKRSQDMIKSQWAIGQSGQNRLNENLYDSNANFRDNYNMGTGMNLGSYDEIMQGYRNMLPGGSFGGGGGGSGGPIGNNSYAGYKNLANGPGFGWDPLFRGAMSKAIGGYGEFADTGGFSPQAIQDIRARGVAPMRATYANAQNELDRSRSLTGGGVNYAASAAKMARELGYGLSDQMTNINADIAQMVQQGRLAGLGGLSSTGASGQGLSTNIDALNLQGMLAGLQGMVGIDQARAAANRAGSAQGAASNLAALRGMTDLYGTNPALANVFGSQVLNSEQNLLASQGLQNQFSNAMMGNQTQSSQIPGNFASAMQNINSVIAPVSNIAGMFAGFGGGGYRQPNMAPPSNYGTSAPSDRWF